MLCIALSFGTTTAANASVSEGILGSIEFKALSLTSLPKWTSVLDKIKQEEERFKICARDKSRCTEESYSKWVEFIKELQSHRNMPVTEKLDKVNNFANQWPYKTDWEVWQKSDYWESPGEFLKYSGDCEDYAITKFVSLKKLGFPAENVRLVIVQDTIRNIAHAVLSVKLNEEYYVLDSLINMVVSDEILPHYIPQYSINDTTRWAHIMPIRQADLTKEEHKEKSPLNIEADDPYLLLFDNYGE